MSYAIHIPQVGSPDVLQRIEHDIRVPTKGQVLIRNHATAVNFIDTIIRRGEMPAGMMPDLPHIPGVEGAGFVEAVGEGVQGISVGERVAWMGPIGAGGYSTHSVIDAHYVTPISASTSFNAAAALPVNAMTAWHMLVNLGHAQAGDTVLIHAAAGGVGTMAIHIAKHLGLTVIASVSSGKKDYARAQGADHVIDYKTEVLVERVKEITDGRGVDISLNPISGDSLRDDMSALAPLGTVVLFGFLAGPPAGTFAEDMAQHFQKSIAVRVSDIYTYFTAKPDAFNRDMQQVFELARSGVLVPTITVQPLVDAAQAHQRLEAGETTGKLVLEID